MENELFASATDWVAEIFGGIRLRYACAHCNTTPLRSVDFWRLTAEATARATRGHVENGIWARPCC
eukprot:7850204-Lingulodinium_polyedra.AAC.1